MAKDFIEVAQSIFSAVWYLMTTWYFPGTKVTPAALMSFSMFLGLLLKFLSRLRTGGSYD